MSKKVEIKIDSKDRNCRHVLIDNTGELADARLVNLNAGEQMTMQVINRTIISDQIIIDSIAKRDADIVWMYGDCSTNDHLHNVLTSQGTRFEYV